MTRYSRTSNQFDKGDPCIAVKVNRDKVGFQMFSSTVGDLLRRQKGTQRLRKGKTIMGGGEKDYPRQIRK